MAFLVLCEAWLEWIVSTVLCVLCCITLCSCVVFQADACKSVEYAFKKCPNGIFAEIKYDGERVQVHKKGNEFRYFSRSLKPVLAHKVCEEQMGSVFNTLCVWHYALNKKLVGFLQSF